MPVNFDILKSIKPEPQSFSLPGYSTQQGPQQPGIMEELGQGISKGIENYQSGRLNAQNIESNDMKLQEQKQGMADKNMLRQKAAESQDAYFSALMKIDPVAANKGLQAKQDFQNSILQGQEKVEDIKGKQFENANKINNSLGNFYGGLEALPPEQRQAMYQSQKGVIEKHLPGVKLSDEYNQAESIAIISQSVQNATVLAKDPKTALRGLPDEARPGAEAAIEAGVSKDSRTSLQKDLQRQAQLEKLQSEGQLDQAGSTELQGLVAANQAKGRGAQQLTPGEKVATAVSTDRLKKLGESTSTARKMYTAAQTMEKLAPETSSGTLAKPNLALNKLAESLGVKVKTNTSANEAYNMISTQLRINYQTEMKGATSDRDMETIQQAIPDLGNTAQGKKLMAQLIKYKSNGEIQFNQFLESWVDKNNGSSVGADEAWNNFLQTRNDISKTKNGYSFNEYQSKDWKPYLDKNMKSPEKKEEELSKPTSSITPEQAREELKRRGLIK